MNQYVLAMFNGLSSALHTIYVDYRLRCWGNDYVKHNARIRFFVKYVLSGTGIIPEVKRNLFVTYFYFDM